MNRAGILLDTGPIVALLSKDDAQHQRVKEIFSECEPPFRCCEAVVAEACFLMRKIDAGGPAEVIALGRKGIYEIAINVAENWESLETLLRKYRNRPTSLADVCLIRCADVFGEARIFTFDSDFRIYRWKRTQRFEVMW